MAKAKKPEAPKKKVEYIHRTDDTELNILFYKRYGENLLFNKSIALMCILEDEEQFKKLTAQYQDIDPSLINDKFFESLRAELHFTEIHQFEGFFVLLMAIFSDLPNWIYLTAYLPSEIGIAIRQFLNKDIEALTNGKAKTDREFVDMAVYGAYEPQEEVTKEQWDENLDNIAWLIRRMGEKYIEGKGEYNSYKHGLRVMTGPASFGFSLQHPEGKVAGPYMSIAESVDSFGYLEFDDGIVQTLQDPISNEPTYTYKPKKKGKDKKGDQATENAGNVIDEVDVRRVYEVSKTFNSKESMFHLSIMSRLLGTMKNTRLATLTHHGEVSQLATYFGLNKAEVLALRENRFKIRFHV